MKKHSLTRRDLEGIFNGMAAHRSKRGPAHADVWKRPEACAEWLEAIGLSAAQTYLPLDNAEDAVRIMVDGIRTVEHRFLPALDMRAAQ